MVKNNGVDVCLITYLSLKCLILRSVNLQITPALLYYAALLSDK